MKFRFSLLFFLILGVVSCEGKKLTEPIFETCLNKEVYFSLKGFDDRLNEMKLVDSNSLITYFHYFNRKVFTPETLSLNEKEINGLSVPSVFALMTKCCFSINGNQTNSEVANKYISMVEKNDVTLKRMTDIFESMVDDSMTDKDKRIIAVHLIWVSWQIN